MANEKVPVTTDAQGVWRMDTRDFIPEPNGYITVKGVEYPIYSFLDLTVEDSIRIQKIGEDIERAGEDYDKKTQRSIEQIMMLNKGPLDDDGKPKHERLITPELLRGPGMTARQLVWLTVLSMSIAKVPASPREAGREGQSGSATSAPAPAGSTA